MDTTTQTLPCLVTGLDILDCPCPSCTNDAALATFDQETL
jgi:hypothetical protein